MIKGRVGNGVGMLAAGFLVAVFPLRSALAQSCGTDIYGASTPLGGGSGYPDILTAGAANFFVASRAALVNAIASASPGDVIFLANNANIDLAPAGVHWSAWTIEVDVPDITIASSRGMAGAAGGRLYLDSTDMIVSDPPANSFPPLFRVTAPGVRFTGLRLDGGDYVKGSATYTPPTTDGIVVEGEGSLEVDNCEMYGFSHSPMYVVSAAADIHHNHLHHNRRSGLGYGVVLGEDPATPTVGTNAVIESNIFHHNRHDIAATGNPFVSYYARYNLILGEGPGHAFDMHGEGESDPSVKSGFGGGEIVIEFNTFVDNDKHAVMVRGAPYVFGYVDNNWFTHSVPTATTSVAGAAIRQRMEAQPWVSGASGTTASNPPPLPAGVTTTNGFNRMRQQDNCFDQTGWFRFDTKYQTFFPLARSSSAASSLALVNFDGDSKADVLKVSGGVWQVSYDGISNWTTVATGQPYAMSELRFGDFVGDSRTDVFRSTGGVWYAWNIATSAWTQLASSSHSISTFAFGNFVGDSKTDVFRAAGAGWFVSESGVGTWQPINSSSVAIGSLAFGDFVGDGRTDVFRATGSEWVASDAGATNWQHLAWSTSGLNDLLLGNFIGNSKTDVLIADAGSGGTTWHVSESGSTTATLYGEFGHGEYPASILRAADFTGDGKSDVFLVGQP